MKTKMKKFEMAVIDAYNLGQDFYNDGVTDEEIEGWIDDHDFDESTIQHIFRGYIDRRDNG